MSFVLNEFSQTANIECKLTTYGTKGVNNLEMSSVSTISHEERLLPQRFFVNDVFLKCLYYSCFRVKYLPEGGFCIFTRPRPKRPGAES